ncbi:MAG: tRNA1(Val) (adenine(37)-N6)-methyltransferase [Fusobacteriaceae bacterium]|nr:tRNA1(Val) (adenine(37)-N6)-methyltransferase [Fusobacteriaceae bacterium]
MLKNEKESIIDLLKKENLKIIQRSDYFNFSIDSILLAEFASLGRGVHKIIELGTGNGAIPLFLSKRTKAKIIGLELQETSADLAIRNISLNNLEKQITIINDDMKNWRTHFLPHSFDSVICNPPFFKFNGNTELLNNLDQLTLARHEIAITLEEIISIAANLLNDKGYFSLVHRADRAIDIIAFMKKYEIEPKRVRFCHSKIDKNAKIILIEGIKFGNEGITVLPPLITHDEKGGYSKEVLDFFK